MVAKFLVIDERFDVRKDQSRHRLLTLADQERPALIMTLDYEPTGDDLTKLPAEGKAVETVIELACKNFRWNAFQSRMVVEGPILAAQAPNGAPKPVGK